MADAGEGQHAGEPQATKWPEHFREIPRITFSTPEKMIQTMKEQALRGEPLVIEDTRIVNTDRWSDIERHLGGLLGDREVLVKRSPTHKFRYFDMKKNTGKYTFKKPLQEEQRCLADFLSESQRILQERRTERMYLQETLSGHSEMAEEFASWRWELLIKVSAACGWGLPDSNELFVGMAGVETPLHFDERENLFFQVRGAKEIVVFPFVDYARLYPFPTSHPCDRQSMVGNPISPNMDAFPRFKEAVGHYTTLQAGDLLYLPYGWWHWLRNMQHLAVSISFWSTTPPNDLSGGVPDVFSDHMLTRVRRNLESMVAQQHGPERHNESMLAIREALLEHREGDARLSQVRGLLKAVRMDPSAQDNFLLEMIEGRFGIDWDKHV